MSEIKIACPGCKKCYLVPQKLLGKNCYCQDCKENFTIEEMDSNQDQKVTLTVIQSAKKAEKTVFYLKDRVRASFGRSSKCSGQLPKDDKISRHHFVITLRKPNVTVRDLGSLTGTYINGKKYGGRSKQKAPSHRNEDFPEVFIFSGDEIQVGGTVLRLYVPIWCEYCGNGIPRHIDSKICKDCSEQHPFTEELMTKAVECSRCHREVQQEVGKASGEYICRQCRDKAEENIQVMQQILETRKGEINTFEVMGYDISTIIRREEDMGALYLARNKENHQVVTLRMMLAKRAITENRSQFFLNKVADFCKLSHENIVNIHDFGAVEGGFYFVLENCHKQNIDQIIKEQVLDVNSTVTIILQVLKALGFLHRHEIIHRDVQPQNILFTKDHKAKLCDFGVAGFFEDAGFSGNDVMKTTPDAYYYMPREQAIDSKYLGPPSDIWSAGAILYHMVTGKYPRDFPYGRDHIAIILENDIVPVDKRDKNISPQLAAIINRAIADNIKDRYQSAEEFYADLAKIV